MSVNHWEDIKNKNMNHVLPRKAATWLIANYLERYKENKEKKLTYCNVFFTDMVQQLKLPGPYHWVDKKGNPMQFVPGVAGKATEMLANDIIDWFGAHGHEYGWVKVNKYAALEFAEWGRLVAVTWHSGSRGKSGHIAVLLDDGTIAQAGKGIPFVGLPIESGFGDKTVEYWAHLDDERLDR